MEISDSILQNHSEDTTIQYSSKQKYYLSISIYTSICSSSIKYNISSKKLHYLSLLHMIKMERQMYDLKCYGGIDGRGLICSLIC